MPVIEDDALVLDHHPFGDRHLVVTVLTKHSGVQRGVLRRARGGKAPAAAAVQILSLVNVGLFHRPEAELATFRRIDLLTSSFALTRDLGKTAAAAVVAELLTTFCPPSEPSEHAFRLGVSCLEGLLGGADAETVVAYSQFWTLTLGGVLPPGSEIIEALGDDDAAALAAFRGRNVNDLRDPVRPRVSAWLDRQVRAAAERPLRALDFYRQLPMVRGAGG